MPEFNLKSWLIGFVLGLSGKPYPIQNAQPTIFLYGHVAKEGETPTCIINDIGYIGAVLSKLPEWDRETYPYALITSREGDYNYKTLYLLDRVEYYYHDPDNLNRWSFSLPNGYLIASYNKSRTEWEDFEKRNYTVLNVYDNPFKWSNFDVINEDGSVYLAVSDPVPVVKTGKYSYNDVVLPALPEWDKTVYPYAQIMYYPNNGETMRYVLTYFSHEPTYFYNDKSTLTGFEMSASVPWKVQRYRSNGITEWERYTTNYDERWEYNGEYNPHILMNIVASSSLIWANVEYQGKAFYMAPSDPIPVYEQWGRI